MVMRTLLVSLLVVCLLSACSSGGRPAHVTSSPASPPPSRNTSSVSRLVHQAAAQTAAQLRQWGSVVAGAEGSVRHAAQQLRPCGATGYGPSYPLECSVGRLGFNFTAQTLEVKLGTAKRQIGSPPSEIASLVSGTIADAHAIRRLEHGLDRACGRTVTASCFRALFAWSTGESQGRVPALV